MFSIEVLGTLKLYLASLDQAGLGRAQPVNIRVRGDIIKANV